MLEDWRLMIAFRYLVASGGDRLTSHTTIISGLSLVIAVGVLIIVLSVMSGFERELRQRVLGILPHAVIYKSDADLNSLEQELLLNKDIINVAPLIEGNGLLVANSEMVGVSVAGINPEKEVNVSILDDFFVKGSLKRLSETRFSIVLGKRLADHLNVNIGDIVTFISPEVRMTLVGPLSSTRGFNLVGIFSTGTDIDMNQVYVNLPDLYALQRGQGTVGIRLLTANLFTVTEAVNASMSESEDILYASVWTERHGNLYGAILMQKRIMFLILMLMIAVAAFNVVSTLFMVVDERAGDIAIIRTIRASTNSIRNLFIIYGVVVGSVGIFFGIFFGISFSFVIDDLVKQLDSILGLGLMDEYFIQYLPIDIRLEDICLVALSSISICSLATIYPAWKAARANPVEALQYES